MFTNPKEENCHYISYFYELVSFINYLQKKIESRIDRGWTWTSKEIMYNRAH